MKVAEMIPAAIGQIQINGLWLEFGVASGTTINQIAAMTTQTVYGFDSFDGLPEDWYPKNPLTGEIHPRPKGSYAQKTIPQVAKNVKLVVGLFQDTLPKFQKEKIAFLHMDADLFSSTFFVLEQLNNHIVPGTVILFDDFFDLENVQKAYADWKIKYCRETKMLFKNDWQEAVYLL